jgi:DNA-binding transcriptional MerR regulator
MSESPPKAARKRPERRRSFDVFSTGEVAAICRVAPRTVAHWVDRGDLAGYRLPASKDRRVTREELVRFMTAAGMPTAWIDAWIAEQTPAAA